MMTVRQETILVVDDDEGSRRSLCQKLSSQGYQCQQAGDATQALDRLRNNSVDLMILDIKLLISLERRRLPSMRRSWRSRAGDISLSSFHSSGKANWTSK